ncbi:MAG: Cl-channel, voltage gated [Phycisphaerales bacterium]|nr:Cl-channel, voltage gated [Phycisphaerales bacterium]
MQTAPAIPPSPEARVRSLTTPKLLLGAAMIGAVGGLLATVYYFLLEGAMSGVWHRLANVEPLSLPVEPHWHPIILLITTLGGLAVGLLTRWLGSPGEIAAVIDNIHLHHGRLDIRQTPSMTAISLASISAGGSAGPEAPLVQIIGSFASRLGDRLRLEGVHVRTFTFCGMGAALGAFFGAPLGGALFAMELPHRRGIEYYEALLPAVVSALAAFLVFRSIVGYDHILFHLGSQDVVTLGGVGWGVAFGALGAAAAAVFSLCFAGIGRIAHRWTNRPVLLATLGGLTLGLLAQASPKSLFWGEYQIDAVIAAPADLLRHHTLGMAVALLLGLAAVKMIAVSVTLHSGFRGGFIFPLLFVGAAIGTAASLLLPAAPAAIAIVATMAAVNVAITKTPISTSVVLVTLSGTSMMPIVIAASVTALLLSGRLNLIRTQRGRDDHTPSKAGRDAIVITVVQPA